MNTRISGSAPDDNDERDAGLYLARLNDTRRTRLHALIQDRTAGDITAFAEALGYTRGAIHQFLSPAYNEGRSIGELAARQLEQRAGLPFGWLDQHEPPAVVGGVNVAQLLRNLEETSQNEGSDELACRCADSLTVIKGLLGGGSDILGVTSSAIGGTTQIFGASAAGQREATDAAARTGALRAMSSSSVPAGARLSPTAAVESPVVHAREIYAGVMAEPSGARYHLILLPGDARTSGVEVAQEFAASLGGELPTYAELKVLQKRTHGQFKASLYYTCEQEPHDGDMATMLFDATPAGEQRKDVNELRTRAIRRVPALTAIQEG